LIKKKFNCLDPKAKTSTTLHLFCGKWLILQII
jgi:hypothetical protein